MQEVAARTQLELVDLNGEPQEDSRLCQLPRTEARIGPPLIEGLQGAKSRARRAAHHQVGLLLLDPGPGKASVSGAAEVP